MDLTTLAKRQQMGVFVTAYPILYVFSRSFLSAFVGTMSLDKVFQLESSAGL